MVALSVFSKSHTLIFEADRSLHAGAALLAHDEPVVAAAGLAASSGYLVGRVDLCGTSRRGTIALVRPGFGSGFRYRAN